MGTDILNTPLHYIQTDTTPVPVNSQITIQNRNNLLINPVFV